MAARSIRAKDPWAAFQGLADKPVFLTVNDKPVTGRRARGARADDRQRSRAAALRVDRSESPARRGGQRRRVGYIYVPNTGARRAERTLPAIPRAVHKAGADHRRALEFRRADSRPIHRAARPQSDELLGRARRARLADARRSRTPVRRRCSPTAGAAPAAIVSRGSFAKTKLGPIIGTRTWGGLIGMTGAPPLDRRRQRHRADFQHLRHERQMDHRRPRRRSGHRGDRRSRGDGQKALDPQLERAIRKCMRRSMRIPRVPQKPMYPNRAGN